MQNPQIEDRYRHAKNANIANSAEGEGESVANASEAWAVVCWSIYFIASLQESPTKPVCRLGSSYVNSIPTDSLRQHGMTRPKRQLDVSRFRLSYNEIGMDGMRLGSQ